MLESHSLEIGSVYITTVGKALGVDVISIKYLIRYCNLTIRHRSEKGREIEIARANRFNIKKIIKRCKHNSNIFGV